MNDGIKSFLINQLAQTPSIIEEELREIKRERFFVQELRKAIETSGQRIFIVSGLRGTGKTTALFHLFSSLKDEPVFYLSCDELFSRGFALEDVVRSLDYINKQAVGVNRRCFLLLDEVSYLPNWDLMLKVLSDKRPNLYIVATSSSSIPLKKSVELARRAYEMDVFPLLFREYLSLKYGITIPEELSAQIRKKIGKESLEGEYIKVLSILGGYNLFALFDEYAKHDLPFSLKLTDRAYKMAVERTIKRIVYEDFSRYEKYETKMLTSAEILIKYLSTIPADGVKLSTLSDVAGISKESVVKLLNSFELSMLIKGVSYKGRGRMFKVPKKWFFYSPSIRYVLAFPVSGEGECIGNLREDSVFTHLFSVFNSVFYSHEADFIVNGLKVEVGKGKKKREGTVIFGMEEKVDVDRVPLPLALLLA